MEIRQLAHFNEAGFNNAKREIKTANDKLQKFVNAVNEINGYKVDQAGLQDIVSSHGEMIALGIENSVKDDIAKAGIRSQSVIDAAVKEDLGKVYSLINETKFRINHNFRSLTEINDGIVSIPDEVIESVVKEAFCSYITTEAGLKKKQEYDALIEAAAKFLEGNTAFGSGDLNLIIVRDSETGKIRGRTDISFDNMCKDRKDWFPLV